MRFNWCSVAFLLGALIISSCSKAISLEDKIVGTTVEPQPAIKATIGASDSSPSVTTSPPDPGNSKPNLLPTDSNTGSGPAASSSPDAIPPNVIELIRSISQALSQGDITLFENLVGEQVAVGLYKTDYVYFQTPSEFLEKVRQRLPNQPECATFSISQGSSNVVWVFSTGWDPEWDIDSVRRSETVVFELNAPEDEEYYLYGAYIEADPARYGEHTCP